MAGALPCAMVCHRPTIDPVKECVDGEVGRRKLEKAPSSKAVANIRAPQSDYSKSVLRPKLKIRCHFRSDYTKHEIYTPGKTCCGRSFCSPNNTVEERRNDPPSLQRTNPYAAWSGRHFIAHGRNI
ncbi:unnamed protein product [Calypogeia fissa]